MMEVKVVPTVEPGSGLGLEQDVPLHSPFEPVVETHGIES
jgi:hypothetical protein